MQDLLSNAIWLALTCAWVMAAFALARYLQRRQAMRRGGWRYLTPGPLMWGSLIGSGAMTALFGYIYFFVGSARVDAAVQMTALYFLTMGFLLGALAIAYSMAVEQVRWNDIRVQQRTLLFQHRDLCWNQLAEFGLERWSGYLWISDCDGNKLRFSPYCNGLAELISMIAAHLPTDLPPAETAATIEAALVRAR